MNFEPAARHKERHELLNILNGHLIQTPIILLHTLAETPITPLLLWHPSTLTNLIGTDPCTAAPLTLNIR